MVPIHNTCPSCHPTTEKDFSFPEFMNEEANGLHLVVIDTMSYFLGRNILQMMLELPPLAKREDNKLTIKFAFSQTSGCPTACPSLGITGVIQKLFILMSCNSVKPLYSPGKKRRDQANLFINQSIINS